VSRVAVPEIVSWWKAFWLFIRDPNENIFMKVFQFAMGCGFSVSTMADTYLMANDITIVGAADNVAITPVTVSLLVCALVLRKKVKAHRVIYHWELQEI
jgi:hypothetical protein